MAIVRSSEQKNNRRIFGFRAWHHGLNKMVAVKSCDFEDLDGNAELIFRESGIPFSAKMHELVLLQDTNMSDKDGVVVYEGDIVIARVMNALGSSEEVVAEVVFDEDNWGYNLSFDVYSGLPLTGEMKVMKIIGNVFEGIDEDLLQSIHEEKKREQRSSEGRGGAE